MWLRVPGAAWVTLAAALALASLPAFMLPTIALDWQAAAWRHEPWRAWTAAFVHFDRMHLCANLLGAGLVALLGWRVRASWQLALAWFAAWPLTHLALGLQPALAHYGGLSGVLHAGVAVIAASLAGTGQGRPRVIGMLMLAAMALKLVSETPWNGAVQARPGWEIGIAPFAHVTGTLAGLLCAGLALWASRRARG